MDKVWFIEIAGKAEGPYSIWELKSDARITPDTFVWKEGFTKWLPIRKVPELKEIFKDTSDTPQPLSEEKNKGKTSLPEQDEIALKLQSDFPPFLFWLLITFLIIFYVFYRLVNPHE